MRHCRLRLTFPEHVEKTFPNFRKFVHFSTFKGGPSSRRHSEVTVESGGNFEDYKLAYIRFLSCHLFGPVNHGQTWRGWERSGEKGLIISDNQAQTWLIITINDTSIGDLPLIITISDTCKNQPKRLDFDNTINLSSLIVILGGRLHSEFVRLLFLQSHRETGRFFAASGVQSAQFDRGFFHFRRAAFRTSREYYELS